MESLQPQSGAVMTGAGGERRLDGGEEGDARGAAGLTPAVKGRYLGTSNTICTGETTATRSTLQEEKRSVSSDMGAPGWRWGQRGGHLHARQGVQAGQWVRVHLGLLAFLLPQRGQGSLNTSGSLERAEIRGRPAVRG